jgi:hypothetical protein
MHGHMNVKFRKMFYYHCCSTSEVVVVVVVVVIVIARYFMAQVGIFPSQNTRKID